MTSSLSLSPLNKKDIPVIVDAFSKASWPKPALIFEEYLKEQAQNQRCIWLAFADGQFAGYVTLKWESHYESFRAQNIPEIMDLNVLPDFRHRGIGSLLIERAEEDAFRHADTVGIGVGLYADYGQAIKIYVNRGYKPDGRGVTYNYKAISPGNHVCLDDDLVLWFSKKRQAKKYDETISIQSSARSPHFKWGDNCDGWWLQQHGKFTILLEQMPPNATEKKHFHNYTEQFFYCLSGELEIELLNKKYILKTHEGISVPSGMAHWVKNTHFTKVQFLVISSSNSHNDRVEL